MVIRLVYINSFESMMQTRLCSMSRLYIIGMFFSSGSVYDFILLLFVAEHNTRVTVNIISYINRSSHNRT